MIPAGTAATVGKVASTVMQPIYILPALVLFVAWRKNKSDAASSTVGKDRALSPDQYAVYQQALKEKDPVAMRGMADEFEKQGFNEFADMIRKRAKLKELPEEVKAERARIFREFMKCTDKFKVVEMAKVYAAEGCTGAAQDLLTYAESLP